ncbi:two-component system, OmpR family, response regulator CssR [Paenibacillus algorifonticola]|uniref:Two-component system, OmpR family, response regulator CssR n=1 Tax=Paenibacillus algorifonticola TaxID=684063 RepID=A0A1I2DM53_9BACL|nr:response regulator transcription factor [Paenibacillus algorifonticola]SFE81566.1 two-component system, OmpR family, response regulator CssR [Paenibacillus algorifonticola]
MKSYQIAIVEDDSQIRGIVEAYLQKEGYRTIPLPTAEEAWELWKDEPPDMWILDIMLPGMNGFELCRHIRKEAEVPIIMVSARDEEVDKILGLELGSDDYMTKPFSPRELVARVNRLFHRFSSIRQWQESPASPQSHNIQIEASRLRLSLSERRVFWHEDEIEMTLKEFKLLQTLAEQPNRAFSRDELLDQVWGDDYFGSERAVDDLVKRLRRKINELPIETVWGHGYRLKMEGKDE